MSAFDAFGKRVNRLLAALEHMQLLKRLKSRMMHLPEIWVRLDQDGNEQVMYDSRLNDMHNQETDGNLAALGIGAPTIHPKEYIITDDWNPDMDGSVEFIEWSDHPEGLPPSIDTE